MKFLCLHGAYGSIKNLRVQLGPLLDKLEQEGSASYHFLQGSVPVEPPSGFEAYFGPPPHFRYFRDTGEAERSALEGIRVFPDTATPEDSMRALMSTEDAMTPNSSREETLRHLYKTIEADDDICGVIGYSEGASAAATLILDEQERMRLAGITPRIKCGIFFMGWPALTGDGLPALADEMDESIDVATLHVVGAKDPYKDGAMALYNFCDEDSAVFFDTSGGHTIPRNGQVLEELAQAVRNLIESSQ